jgi:serine/threonine-protein kinase
MHRVKPGDVIAERYRLLRLIDVGGMGEVWAARNELTQKSFAIKFLLPSLAERPDALERFVREAETAGKLDHPAIVNVFDVAQAEDGRPFIVMELLAGECLEDRVERLGPLASLEAAACIAQIAEGLAVAHRAGVVHRDLSAANIFLVRNPEGGRPLPKILDFGVSKTLGPDAHDRTLTGSGAVLGCPEYMSPEQARGAELVDARTDVWSLGAVLYVALAGATPFHAKNYNALMVHIMTRGHRPLLEVAPSADPELAAVVEACLVKDRDRRIQTAKEVAVRLGAITRRLAADSGEMMSPRRRATDRLPRGEPRTATRRLPTLGAEELQSLVRLRSRGTLLGLGGAVLGVGLGIALALYAARGVHEDPPPLPVALPVQAREVRLEEPGVPLAALPRAALNAEAVVPLESDLAVAVARGLKVQRKAPRRR